jgi:transportin-3
VRSRLIAVSAATVSLEQLETFLAVLRTLGSGLPASCAATPAEIWAVIDGLLNRFGSNWQIAERSCALLRRGITFFGPAARSVVPAVIDRMSTCFEESQISGYLWITGKLGTNFGVAAEGGPLDEEVVGKVVQAWERETQVFTAIVNRESATSFPDGALPPVDRFSIVQH